MSAVRSGLRALGWPLRTALLLPLAGYRRFLAPVLGVRCRFHPSCSAYAEEAIRTRGAVRGLALSVWRVLRCSPLSAGGVDRVPAGRSARVHDDVIQSLLAEAA